MLAQPRMFHGIDPLEHITDDTPIGVCRVVSCRLLIKNNQLKVRLIYPYFYPYNLDWTLQFRHAPARLRVAANMFALACGYAAICWLVPL